MGYQVLYIGSGGCDGEIEAVSIIMSAIHSIGNINILS